MKVMFSIFSVILLLLAGLCLETSALSIEEIRNKLDGATLISGLNISKSDIEKASSKVGSKKFRFSEDAVGKNEFFLLKQFDSTCGTTSTEMVLHYYGKDVGQKEIWEYGGVHVIEAGSFPSELRQALNQLGVPAKWYHKRSLDDLRRYVRQDRPPIILLRFDVLLHYMVVVGYNGFDFLLADPNGYFRWMSDVDLMRGWSLNPPGLPNKDFDVVDGFERFGLRIAVPAIQLLVSGRHVIVPDSAPNEHFPPNYTPVLFYKSSTDKRLRSGREIVGGKRFNPTWETDHWEETFTFKEDIKDYRVSGVVPGEFRNLGGFEPVYIQGHKMVNSRTVKVWGRITPGSVTRGKIFVYVRGYREPLYGIKTESSTKSKKYSSTWALVSRAWKDSWHTFTFPGDVVGYTISTGIPWEDRLGAKLLEHHKTGNQVKFKISLREHGIEPNEITVNVTAHYEPVVPGSFSISYSGSLNITSGQSKKINVTVLSTKGHRMPGVRVSFIDTNDKEIAFSPASAITNSSGIASSTMKTGSSGPADFQIAVPGVPTTTYKVTVAKKLKTYTVSRQFLSRHAGCKTRAPWPFRNRCLVYHSRDGYNLSGSIDIPSSLSVHAYSISSSVSIFDDWVGTKPYVKSHSRSGNRVNLTIRMVEHWFEPNEILVKVHAKYWGTEPSPGAPLNPEVRPDPDMVTSVWQDLSYIPAQTTLLPNYPNPFNPETWIPYHLAEPAKVKLRIYAADGRLVRILELGHQPAGIYENKSRAAYWDGRNSVGERVASGLYFYTLTAGDFAATRKMLIMK